MPEVKIKEKHSRNVHKEGHSKKTTKKKISDTTVVHEGVTVGVAPPPVQQIEGPINYPPLKVSLWSRMGGFFRNGVRAGLGAGIVTGVTYGAAAAIAASTLPYATAVAATYVAATLTTGGVGFAAIALGGAVAAVSAVVRAVNPRYKENLNQKALLRKLSKELIRGKNHTLTKDQQKTLQAALQNPKWNKLINKLGKKFDGNLRDALGFAAEHGYTNVPERQQPQRTGILSFFRSIFRRREVELEETQEDDYTEDETQEDEIEEERDNDEILRKITNKTIGINFSAREWLALQQIYAEQRNQLTKDLAALRKMEQTPEVQQQIAEKELLRERVKNMERRAFNAAKSRTNSERLDLDNSVQQTERDIYAEFNKNGRRSTRAKEVVTDADRVKAEEALQAYIKVAEAQPPKKKPTPGSGGRR